MAIPTREQIYQQITAYHESPPENVSLLEYISTWLDTLELPETVIVASTEINPKQQIMDDLDSYAQ